MPDDPVLPQRAVQTNALVMSVEWLFEPLWPGDRLMARKRSGRLTLTDAEGRTCDAEYAETIEALEPAILADDALIDGVWTPQPFIGDGSAARNWADTLEREGLSDEVPDPLETERRRAFVAIDLVEIDGEELYDVPFQERRRLLEGVIDEGIQVRVSPIVKQPVDSWLTGWRANGFTHYVAKHQNSRYYPGKRTDDWLEISTRGEVPRGMIGRMFGMRGERQRRIQD